MRRIDALTGIRAYAALWVVFFHLYASARDTVRFGPFQHLVAIGPVGVDLFFILSGFVIAYVHQSKMSRFRWKDTLHFYGLRIARIFPVHYFMLFLYVLYLWLGSAFLGSNRLDQATYKPDALIYNLLNIQAWGVLNSLTWNIPAWSISAEWFAYLLFPFLNPFVIRINQWRSCVFLIVLLLVTRIFASICLSDSGWSPGLALWQIMLEFPMGCLLYNLSKQVTLSPKMADILSCLCALAMMIGIFIFHLKPVYVICFFPALLLFLAVGKGPFTTLFSNRITCFLGEISFSIYMTHLFTLTCLDTLAKLIHRLPAILASPLNALWSLPPLTLGVQLLSIVGIAYLVYRFVEIPSRNVVRQRINQGLSQAFTTTKPLPEPYIPGLPPG